MRFILVILCCVSFLNYAQEGTVIGQVVDEKGNPLIGASIIYRGDVTLGASTDIEGNYKLKLPVGNRKIICRFTDMVRSEEHTSELQARPHLVCRLLLEKKKIITIIKKKKQTK